MAKSVALPLVPTVALAPRVHQLAVNALSRVGTPVGAHLVLGQLTS